MSPNFSFGTQIWGKTTALFLCAPTLQAATKPVQNMVMVTLDPNAKANCTIRLEAGKDPALDGITCKRFGDNKKGANSEMRKKGDTLILEPGQTVEMTFSPNVKEDGSSYLLRFIEGDPKSGKQYLEYSADKPVDRAWTIATNRWIVLAPGSYHLDAVTNGYGSQHMEASVEDGLKKAFTQGKGDAPGTLKISF
jgi:hypothetical protein